MESGDDILVIASGGLDSTALAYHLLDQGHRLRLVSFDYGQRHRVELRAAARIADEINIPHEVVDLVSVGRLLSGSALTDPEVAVPDGHYTDLSMRSTIVPNRNAIMTAVAVGIASASGCECVALGVHAGDHAIYPDCRPAFVDLADRLARTATEDTESPIRVIAPFVTWTKRQIVARGASLGVPFAMTWSCYRGGERHCGSCGTCIERREAFELASVPDPTAYGAIASSTSKGR
ncbi:7-cyano-7-deazaguanine synthase QueC [Streptosporangium oxazolinicum]|uniref:7-cyano-7-deazaguanine synthase n=1 Tax=Streptosporangium oxazolinicum TaxID=909287 RepID=A0ABP8B679_9ACTN